MKIKERHFFKELPTLPLCVIKAGSCDRLAAEVPFIANNNSSITELITALFSLTWASLLRIIHSGWQVPSPVEG